jgi:hypothetical protein
VDTVEWGSGERHARRLPALRLAVPRVGGLALAAVGFALLVAAEIVPWATVQSTSTTSAAATLGSNSLAIGLDRVTSGSGYTYHLGAIVLLGAVGLVLTSPPARRRLLMGLALGVAAGQVLMVLAVTRTALRTFDTLTVLSPSRSISGFQSGLSLQTDTGFRVVLGEGVYLASAAVLLLAAASVTGGLLRRDAVVEEPEPAPEAAPAAARRGSRPAAAPGPAERDDDRELTVTPLEPMDESYFARE